MNKIDRIIEYFRNLNEDSMVTSSAPTNRVGDGGLTSKGKTLAGFDPIMRGTQPLKRKTLSTFASGGRGSRKNWLNYLKQIKNK